MNTSPFNSNVNWFDFDDAQIGKNRLNAKALLNFIDSGDLETVMSTAELNASVEPLGFVYHQVGWLDRDLTGKVFCRGQDLAKSDLPNGQLFIIEKADVPILVPVSKGASPENESVNELSGQKQFGFSLRKIGAIFDKQVALDSLPESVVRGIPVFLRFSVTASGSFAFAVENAKGLSEKSQESTK